MADSLKRQGVDGADRRVKSVERLQAMTYEEARRGSILIGTPDRVTEQLAGLRADLGLDGIMIEMNTGGLIPHDREKEALRLLCQDVMPRFN